MGRQLSRKQTTKAHVVLFGEEADELGLAQIGVAHLALQRAEKQDSCGELQWRVDPTRPGQLIVAWTSNRSVSEQAQQWDGSTHVETDNAAVSKQRHVQPTKSGHKPRTSNELKTPTTREAHAMGHWHRNHEKKHENEAKKQANLGHVGVERD
jgi:hypothetical protein